MCVRMHTTRYAIHALNIYIDIYIIFCTYTSVHQDTCLYLVYFRRKHYESPTRECLTVVICLSVLICFFTLLVFFPISSRHFPVSAILSLSLSAHICASPWLLLLSVGRRLTELDSRFDVEPLAEMCDAAYRKDHACV